MYRSRLLTLLLCWVMMIHRKWKKHLSFEHVVRKDLLIFLPLNLFCLPRSLHSMKQLTADSIASLFCRLPRHWILVPLLCQHESFSSRTSSNGTEAAVLKFVFNFYARVRWSEMQSPRHFCWRVCPGWLIGYRICDITFFVPNQLHLILQLLCSLAPTCYTNWSLKLSLLVQLGYHIGYNESENVSFSGRSYEAKVTTYLFTKCAEKVQSWFAHQRVV